MRREISEGSVAREMPQMFGNLINSVYKSLDDLANANSIEAGLPDSAVEIMPAIRPDSEHKEGAQQQVVEMSQDSVSTGDVVREESQDSERTDADVVLAIKETVDVVSRSDAVPLSIESDVMTVSDTGVTTQSTTDSSVLALPLVPVKREVLGPNSFCAMRAGLETVCIYLYT